MRTHPISRIVFLVCLLTTTLTFATDPHQDKDKFVVVLDAGHGGKDPGKNPPHGLNEKEIALEITLRVGSELEKNPHIKVIYTRTTDVFVDLFDRGKIANEADADLFVSIHCNAHRSQAYGTETYVLGIHRNETNFEVAKAENEVILLEEDYEKRYNGFDPNSPESVIGLTLMQEEFLDQSIMLAREIEDQFAGKLGRKSRGVKYAGLIVLHQTYMPSVLVETGFVTNEEEGAYLNSKKGQAEISSSIAQSIENYIRRVEEHSVDLVFNTPLDSAKDETFEEVYPNIVFKVQIAASSKKLEPKPFNFKGLDKLSREKEGNLYRYFYGNTSDYAEIKKLQQEAISHGYASSFIVSYKNGSRIDLNEALKTTAN